MYTDIAEIDPERLSEEFRRSIIRKMESVLLEMVKRRGIVPEEELPAPMLKKLEKKLVGGVKEMGGVKQDDAK